MYYLKIFITIIGILWNCSASWADSETNFLPFDQRHLEYPDFKSDLEQISRFLGTICTFDEDKLAAEVKDVYLQACAFPKLLKLLRTNTQAANELFAQNTITTRKNAQFIDLEFGWVYHDPFALGDHPADPIINLIVLRKGLQIAMQSMTKLWNIQGHRGSLNGRFYILPKFAAGLERDVYLVRALEYTKTILCLDQPGESEPPCIQKQVLLGQALNNLLNEYQSRSIEVNPRIQPYAEESQNFRLALAAWFKSHSTPTSILNAVKTPDAELKKLQDLYSQLIDTTKRIQAPEINVLIAQLNFKRYVKEQQPFIAAGSSQAATIVDVSNLTPEIVDILAHAQKQMDLYYLK